MTDEQDSANLAFGSETELSDAERLARLKAEHRAIDREITALSETGVADMLKLRRMKKVKLALKDRIRLLEDAMTPDIIA